ncbi:hypothetical protein AB0910_15670 [Streptomyces sp. NPDC047002]|uniref:hypothetical protein n=1 Tax=Streptomyces sp. NPDC047002 TaxID=3155475 RepID=UPI00345573B6
MRLRRAAVLSLGLAAAVAPAHVAAAPHPAPAARAVASAPAPVPLCGAAAARDFPIRARLRGGPAVYRAGGGAQTWYVDLVNTTRRACRNVHPVLVVTGAGRRLTAAQITLRLADGHGVPRTLPLHTSDEDEVIGVVDRDTTGLTVPARGTVSLEASLAFAGDAPEGPVTVSAAAVQREGNDGGWVGASAPYRLRVVAGGEDADTAPGGSGRPPGTPATPGAPTAPAGSTEPGGSTAPATPGMPAGPGTDPWTSPLPLPPQLAATGAAGVLARTGAAVGLIAGGAGIVVLVERRRTRRS